MLMPRGYAEKGMIPRLIPGGLWRPRLVSATGIEYNRNSSATQKEMPLSQSLDISKMPKDCRSVLEIKKQNIHMHGEYVIRAITHSHKNY